MTIRYLEIFVEVCKYMNMSRAAQSLMISQSSVSQAVKALEKEYNVLLFERLNHNLYLTAAGEKMLYLATQVLKSIGRLNSAMHNAPVSLNIGSCNAGEVFVGRESGSATDLLLKNVFAKNGLPLKINCVCNSAASVKLAVKNKMGIAFISRFLVNRELKEHKLGCINLCSKVFTRRFGIIYHKDKVLSKEFTRFTGFCRQLGQQGLETLLDDN